MKQFLFPITLGLLFVLPILSMLYAPQYTQTLGNVMFFLFLALALWMIAGHRWRAHRRGEATRSQIFLRLLLDVLGLALTFVCATQLGRLAGNCAIVYGVWAGLVFGGVVCFLTAWLVSRLWKRFTEKLES